MLIADERSLSICPGRACPRISVSRVSQVEQSDLAHPCATKSPQDYLKSFCPGNFFSVRSRRLLQRKRKLHFSHTKKERGSLSYANILLS
jgi:hypothetical protein